VAGRTIVITGASDGLGAAAAKRLSRSGEHVVVVGRSPQKTAAVASDIGADHLVADFADLGQVRKLADDLLSRYPRIDVLANNAGGLFGARQVTVDGHEKTFQVNHLAPFLLTNLLLDRLIESKASVVNTSSVGNKLFGRLDIDDLESEHDYSAQRAYGTAKLENILFTRELHRRYHDAGISTAALHPGGVASNFGNESPSRVLGLVYRTPLKNLALITPEQGSDLLVWLICATPGEDWTAGEYYSGHSIGKANKQAYDPHLARELWDRSAAMITNEKGTDS
jgi:NAD(P)-dependent dehydrogenase (short-subunit alcohol dehydrogenase family)